MNANYVKCTCSKFKSYEKFELNISNFEKINKKEKKIESFTQNDLINFYYN